MSTRVYQFGLRSPIEGEAIVRQQLRAAHDYQNDLVAIERGRRSAMRAVHETDAVREAIATLKASTKSSRVAALRALSKTRREAQEARADECARIKELDAQIRRDARALTSCYWGSYLQIEAAADQTRKMPLYGDDAVTPNDPRFLRGPRWRDVLPAGDPRAEWWRADGQIGVQLQGGLSTADALAGSDTRVRLVLRDRPGSRGRRYGTLWLRVGSDGRAPVWAKFPIKLHRAIPDAAAWKWVRVSLRTEGLRETWTCEITLDMPHEQTREHLRTLDRDLRGAVAVEIEWVPLDDGSMRVATWLDDCGGRGAIVLPARIVTGIRKPDGIRAVRDLVLNDLRPKLARLIREAPDGPVPAWLREAAAVMHIWKSPDRFLALAGQWRRDRCDAARAAYDLLDAWEFGERKRTAHRHGEHHLRAYECGSRREALRERREFYRVLAARWSRQYRCVLLPDRDLSREARFGEDADRRFTASPQELRGALSHAFGAGSLDARWKGKHGVEEEENGDAGDWLTTTIERWRGDENAVVARMGENGSDVHGLSGNAWARRKARKAAATPENGTAREPVSKDAE